jgi:hypothetical protein
VGRLPGHAWKMGSRGSGGEAWQADLGGSLRPRRFGGCRHVFDGTRTGLLLEKLDLGLLLADHVQEAVL